MNHDATHCADYKKNVCPKSCYRAQLTEELRNIVYPLPTSWSNFKGTKMCPQCKPDYEAEYNRLMELHHKQDCELREYREKFRYLEQENREMRAKLDMVYLIFGGKN